jgi:DNA invertase Pin-like site-specific DNA recombinase
LQYTHIMMRAVGYVRVSTEEQADSGAGLAAQRQVIEREVERREWLLVRLFQDSASGKSLRGRPGLEKALQTLESGEADALVVAKLDRLSRSITDFGALLERAAKKGWAPVVLDLGVDATTPSGELVANVMASVAQWERRAIGQRTKDALAVKRQQGVRLGRPSLIPAGVVHTITALRDEGMSLREIAARLNEEGVPTGQGGKRWYASTVRTVLRSRRVIS